MDKDSPLHNLCYVKELIIVLLVICLASGTSMIPQFSSAFLILLCVFLFRNNLDKNERHWGLGLFMSPAITTIQQVDPIVGKIQLKNRHFMVAPVDCKILSSQHIYINKDDAERRRTMFVDANNGMFYIDQIVSKFCSSRGIFEAWLPSLIYPERCVIFNKPGDVLKQGERFGLIRFGSMIEYSIPSSYKIVVKPGMKVGFGDIVARL